MSQIDIATVTKSIWRHLASGLRGNDVRACLASEYPGLTREQLREAVLSARAEIATLSQIQIRHDGPTAGAAFSIWIVAWDGQEFRVWTGAPHFTATANAWRVQASFPGVQIVDLTTETQRE